MLNTKTLQKVGNPSFLHRALHHPDPLTRQQTQRFLDAVTTSFRKNLDEEHGWSASERRKSRSASGEAQQHHATPAADAALGLANPVADRARPRPTDHHLSSILSSPLFRPPPPSVPKPPGAKRDPMDVFDQAVSKGLMTLPIAAGCLVAKRRMISESRNAILDSQASANTASLSEFNIGGRVLGWLRSSGMDRTLEFAHHGSFIEPLVPFLVAEGKEDVIWTWLASLMSRSDAHGEASSIAARQILFFLARSKAFDVECVDSAFESVIRASEAYRDHPRHEILLTKAWRYIAWRATSPFGQQSRPSVSLFDAYLGVANHLDPPRTKLPVAHLHLHHPATPTHDRALEYFEQVKKSGGAWPADPVRRKAIVGVDTVTHLGLIGQLEEAKSLMRFIHDKYSSFFQRSLSGSGEDLLGHLGPG